MSSLYNMNALKKPTNLTVNSDLLSQAKEYNINLSATLEAALADVLKQRKIESWKEKNKDAISAYNKTIEEYGLFSDELRMF